MTVASSTIRSNAASGVQLDAGAHGVFNSTHIEWNGTNLTQPGMGILATGAHVVVNAGNVIAHNREDGIQVVAASTLVLSQSTVSDNGGSGVFGYLGANVVLHGNTIVRNNAYGVQCRAHCTTQLGGATIENNAIDGIAIILGSALIFEESATQSSGNAGWGLWCGDNESSVFGLDHFNGAVFEAAPGSDLTTDAARGGTGGPASMAG